MKASYQWLKELSGVDASAEQYATWLTSLGLEVEAVHKKGGFEHIVIAEVRGTKPVPKKDKLNLVTVFDGSDEHEVICGAPNVPEAGGRVLFAKLGAYIPGPDFTIEERKIGGVISRGMLCSADELQIGASSEGIFIVPDAVKAAPGTPIDDALGLRDSIFELGLTPNRPDALGHIGLAREICLAAAEPFALDAIIEQKYSDWSFVDALPNADTSAESGLRVQIADADVDKCPRYVGTVLDQVRVGPSPFAVQYRLFNLGVRPISNLVDATNLVLLETGHPTHAFDMRTLTDGKVVVRSAQPGETLVTLDDQERKLEASDLLICDAKRAAALAGIMGGADTEIKDSTDTIVLEAAYFSPTVIRRTSKRLGMHTDASHRFERGVDPNALHYVTARGIAWLQELAGARVVGKPVDAYPKPIGRHGVRLRRTRIEKLLGYTIEDTLVERTLTGIGAHYEKTDEGWTASCPTHRPDLTIEADLIEEVARVAGLDRCPTVMPATIPSSDRRPAHVLRARLRQAAADAGLSEAINYAFTDPKLLESLGYHAQVELKNPLSEEKAVLRPALAPGLLRNAQHALRHQVDHGALFEIGRIFEQPKAGLPVQRTMVAFLLFGSRQHWIGPGENVDFFDIKGCVQRVFAPLTKMPLRWELCDKPLPTLHPKKTASICLGDTTIGYAGILHPDMRDTLDIEVPVVLAEVDLDLMLSLITQEAPRKERPLPRFPASRRDIALLLDEGYTSRQVAEQIEQSGGELVESVELFDLYRGERLPDGKKSMAFRIQYRDRESTLTDKKVEKLHDAVVKQVAQKFGASLR